VCVLQAQVLIATDAAGRVLELLLALERAWTGGRLPYPLALVTGGSVEERVHDAAPGQRQTPACLANPEQCTHGVTMGPAACKHEHAVNVAKFGAAVPGSESSCSKL
jgi:hypothetical protein